MQAYQPEATAPLPRAGGSSIENWSVTSDQDASTSVRSVVARLAAVFDRRACVERAIADKYACHSWCDSTERQMTDELMRS